MKLLFPAGETFVSCAGNFLKLPEKNLYQKLALNCMT
jgi:hypothetical protein